MLLTAALRRAFDLLERHERERAQLDARVDRAWSSLAPFLA
jgi:hypothetical protein